MNERFAGVPLPIWILALAGGIYVLAHYAQRGAPLPSVLTAQSFTTPPNSLAQANTNPQPSGSAPGTAPNWASLGTAYNPTALPPTAIPTILGPGITGGGLNTWQSYAPPASLGSPSVN